MQLPAYTALRSSSIPPFSHPLRQHDHKPDAVEHQQHYKPTHVLKQSLHNRNVGEDGTFREQTQSAAASEESLVSTEISKEKLDLAQSRRPQKA